MTFSSDILQKKEGKGNEQKQQQKLSSHIIHIKNILKANNEQSLLSSVSHTMRDWALFLMLMLPLYLSLTNSIGPSVLALAHHFSSHFISFVAAAAAVLNVFWFDTFAICERKVPFLLCFSFSPTPEAVLLLYICRSILLCDARWMCVTGYEILLMRAKTKETSFPLKFIVWIFCCCVFCFFFLPFISVYLVLW